MLDQAHLYYSSLSWFLNAGREQSFLKLIRQTARQRGYGDFYGFVLVAQGAGELMIEYGCHPWDLCALSALISEAGGLLTTWGGKSNIYQRDVIASNKLVHEQALKFLQE